MKSFAALTRAQWWSFWREKQTVFWIIAFPLMFLLLFGALFRDAGATPTAIIQVGNVALIDQLPADARRQVDSMFAISRTDDLADAVRQVEQGQKAGAITMDGATLLLRYSQTDQVRAATVVGGVRALVDSANIAATGRPPAVTFDARQVEDVSLKPIESMAPGLLGWAVAMGAVFGSAMPFVQWRTTKVLRRLRLAPVSTAALIASRALVTVTVAVVQTALFAGIGIVVFGLRLPPTALLALPLLIAATLAFMGLGLIVGAVSKTPEAASGLANVLIVPMAFMSGSFVPLDVAPAWLTQVSTYMPLKYLNDGLIDVMVRGLGPEAIIAPLLALLAIAALLCALATKMFRWDTETA